MTKAQNGRVLITGANGFVGLRLCDEVRRKGWQVRGAVRSPCQLAQGVEPVTVGHIQADTQWMSALHQVDVVIHLAARVHVMQSDAVDPLADYLKVNLHGTENLAKQAANAGVQRFIYLSSVKVNGEVTLQGSKFTEDGQSNPQDPYGVSKWQAEEALRKIARDTALEMVIIRPPLVYGPGVKANFAALMRAVQGGWPLALGSVQNRRSLVALDNLVDLILTCVTHPQASNQTFMVSDGHDLSTTELVRGLARAANMPARLMPVPVWALRAGATLLGMEGEVQRLCGNLQVDISKAQRVLGWHPPVAVDEALRRAVAGVHPK
jgi:nucleoside-diphosphate-sugar epimerase